ncbi:MAG: PEP/pyruvate-binding domain-containing protein, partial [Calditrichia bacterium]
MTTKKMREQDSVKINEALRDEVHDCIAACREQSAREIKKTVWQIAEKHLPGVEKTTIQSAIKEILVDFLIGDRRLKLPRIRKILTDYRNIEQLILMVSKLYGKGTIGSKALGLETAYAILNNAAVRRKHQITLPVYKPDSYYLGSNLLLDFFNHNKHLGKYRRLKNETFENIIAAQEELEHDFMTAKMPASVMQYLDKIIREIDRPIIVRSSSKLEDNVDASFAGQYASFFLANEGSFEDRLDALEYAVRKTWRSLFSADAIVYRIKMGFLHRDEQMGILLQRVIGRKFEVKYLDSDTGEEKIRRFFAPTVAA